MPLILTDVGGASTVLRNGENGILIGNSDDSNELTAALSTVCNAAQRENFAARARLRMQDYGLATMIDSTENLYCRLAIGQTVQPS